MLITAILLLPASAWATPPEHPAVDTQAAGTNIVGDQESAVGLYLMPWQNEAAGDADRPPALVSEPVRPVDAASFESRIRVDDSIAAYRRSGLNRN